MNKPRIQGQYAHNQVSRAHATAGDFSPSPTERYSSSDPVRFVPLDEIINGRQSNPGFAHALMRELGMVGVQ